MWRITKQLKVQELNEALNNAIAFSRERRKGGVSGMGIRTWEGMEERLERILELLCEVLVWEGRRDETWKSE